MPRLIRTAPLWIWPLLAILVLGVWSLSGSPAPASAATYTSPFWVNNSSSPECPGCAGCGCPRPSEFSPEGVSVRTGELVLDIPIFTTPGMLGDNVFGLRWRSEVSGLTQMGNGMLSVWEDTVEKVVLNSQDPEGNGGHEVLWRRSDGLIVTYDWDGTAYSTLDCSIHDTLSKNGSGNYVITGKWGATKLFDANGMPDKYTDRNA